MKNKPKHSSKKNAKLNPDITPMSCLYLKGKGRLKKDRIQNIIFYQVERAAKHPLS